MDNDPFPPIKQTIILIGQCMMSHYFFPSLFHIDSILAYCVSQDEILTYTVESKFFATKILRHSEKSVAKIMVKIMVKIVKLANICN